MVIRNINMDFSDLDSFLNSSEMESMNNTNQWGLSSDEFNLTEGNVWDQYIQEPPSDNSSLESPEIRLDDRIEQYFVEKNNNVEEAKNNGGRKRRSSHTNIPSVLSFGDPGSPIELYTIPNIKKISKKLKTTRSRPESANREHVIAERKRRERVSENLFTLSGLIPGLKKRDKASVLKKAIEYTKQMQEKVRKLEEQVAEGKNAEALPTVEQSKLVSVSINDEQSPKIEIKAFGNTFLIKIHCFQACGGTLVKALNIIESLHLKVVTANSVQFSEQILDLTITSQVEEGFKVTMKDLFNILKLELEKFV